MLKVVGKTEGGITVVSGVFRFYESTGLPLDVMLDCLKKNNIIPDWLTFYVEVLRAGMQHDRIISKLDEAIHDIYGSKFRDTVIERIDIVARPHRLAG